MKNTVLKYGLIGGIIISILMFSTLPFMDKDTDMGNAQIIGYLTMIIAFAPMFIGIRSYRDKALGGSISFGKALLMGLYITLIVSTLYVVSWMILSNVYLTDFMDTYITNMLEQMQAEGASQDIIDAKMAEMEQMAELYKNPVFKALFTYMEILPVGILLSLIAGLTLKKKQP